MNSEKSRPERLKAYTTLVSAKHGGLEGLRDVFTKRLPQAGAGVEESVDSSPPRVDAATKALESFERGGEPQPHELDALEAIIDAEIRPVINVVKGKYQSTHPLWTQLSTDVDIRARLEACMASIGRIELPGQTRLPYGGTGFVVGDGLVMTNRHVAELFARGLGARATFRPRSKAGIDFLRELDQPTGPVFKVTRIVMIHPYWDMALLAIDGAPRPVLKLSLGDARELRGRDVAVIGYPAFDPRNPVDEQQTLFAGRYGVKRLQPGELQGGARTASFAKLVNAATHDCSTLGGNSGSAIIDLSSGEVLGLHFGGSYKERNFAVPSSELARDARVVDAGVKFAGTPSRGTTSWENYWRRADETPEPQEEDDDDAPGFDVQASAPTRGGNGAATATRSGESLMLEIPIRVVISVGPRTVVAADQHGALLSQSAGETLEAMREPFRDDDYASRRGYDPDFLGTDLRAAMPKARNASVLAPLLSGGHTLDYQNFSILMHQKRRLALVTASNVTKEPALRKPESGRDYTRKGLSGLRKNDVEKWFLDPRMDAKYQIPDVFFTKDRQAFDKGHLVRRDDVAWGESYDELRRANGDSYHVTNCSPQVASFNRSANGELNWGDLENRVLSEAASERLCVFAGPILAAQDQVFKGVSDGGKLLSARIPSRYWKVIVSGQEDGLASYGFILEQELDDVQFEFTVPDEFLPTMVPLSEIADAAGIKFAASVLNADRFDTGEGVELAAWGGIRRRVR